MTIYDRLMKSPRGARALSSSRLKYEVLKVLHSALLRSGLNQAEWAARLGIRKSAVNQVLRGDGNVRISTLADYLHEAGFELKLTAVPLGRSRAAAVREMKLVSVRHLNNRESSDRPAARLGLEALVWRDERIAKLRADRHPRVEPVDAERGTG